MNGFSSNATVIKCLKKYTMINHVKGFGEKYKYSEWTIILIILFWYNPLIQILNAQLIFLF